MTGKFRDRASLLLNVVLIAAVVALVRHKLAYAAVPRAIATAVAITSDAGLQKTPTETPLLALPAKLPQYTGNGSASDRRRWLIDQLRAMGVPNETLALVALVDFKTQWGSRFEACGVDRDKLAQVQLDMDLSEGSEMLAALGPAGFKEWDQKNMLWEAMSTKVDATPSESDAIYALKQKLHQRALELEQARVKGTMDDAEIGEAQEKAYSEFNQQLRAVLGDSRYEKSQQLDDDFAAGNLRYTLTKAGVNPNDSQFQELFEAERQCNQSQLKLDPASPDYAAKLKSLTDVRDQEYRQVLGAAAFDTLQKEQDPGYSEMKKYATVWGLDDGKIDYVYNAMKNYEKNVQDYQASISALQAQGQKVDSVVVNQTLKQLTDQTGQAIQSYLGDYSFNKLQRNRLFLFNPAQVSQ